MFKRIALAALLLVGTALIAHVWADEDCPYDGEQWQDATDAQTGAGQDMGWAEVMRDTAVEFGDAVANCYANHGGATSEVDYQSAMTDADNSINAGDFVKGVGTVEFGHGDSSMAAGNMLCPSDHGLAASSYGTAKNHFKTASAGYSAAYNKYLEAVWSYDTAAGYLVGEIEGHGCGCVFNW